MCFLLNHGEREKKERSFYKLARKYLKTRNVYVATDLVQWRWAFWSVRLFCDFSAISFLRHWLTRCWTQVICNWPFVFSVNSHWTELRPFWWHFMMTGHEVYSQTFQPKNEQFISACLNFLVSVNPYNYTVLFGKKCLFTICGLISVCCLPKWLNVW